MSWLSLGGEFNLFKRWNPARPVIQQYNAYVMDSFLDQELDKHLKPPREANVDEKRESRSNRSIVGLAAEIYMRESASGITNKGMDKTFREFTKTQIRTFLFAGHDTTSSSMCYTFYLLFRNPAWLEKLCAEHDAVFGTDFTKAPSILSQQPQLINHLPYTTAVIKEALRLFPPSSSMREGAPDCSVIGSNGTNYPTDGFLIWVLHQALHRNPTYWVRPDEFVPERWLVGPEDPLHPVKDAWRPFEFGSRNCLGQEVAMLEVKAGLILTCREFDIRAAYEDLDSIHPKDGPTTVKGDRMYQIQRIGAHPADGCPCRVRLRNR